MAVKSAVVSVGTTATLLSAGESDSYTGSTLELSVPAGGQPVYLGGSDVTAGVSGNGRPLNANGSVEWDLFPGDQVYGVVVSGTQNVNVLRSGV